MLRVLIVDDHAGFRRLLRAHLRARWPDVAVSERDPPEQDLTPEDYLAGAHDVVLLDYQLGPVNGFDYLRRFRQVPGFPPVIMLTGAGNERLAVDAIRLGATDYIPKQDLSGAQLVRAVQEALDARGAVERFELAEHALAVPHERRVEIRGLDIVRKLGEGGMSSVWLARRAATGEEIVLKVFDQAKAGAEYGEGMERFAREYELVRRMDHPGIVRIHEQGFTDDYAYITMEYFPGGSLREHMRDGVTADQALAWVSAIGDALEVVHDRGVVHRDLKPQNVMLRADGSPVLIDFGVARALTESSDLTRAGTIMGTPHYISPEQVDGHTPDNRSDLYALGVMFYEMLCGCVPYAAGTAMAVLYKHKHSPVPQLPAALAPWQPLIDRFLAKNPRERFQSVQELRWALMELPGL